MIKEFVENDFKIIKMLEGQILNNKLAAKLVDQCLFICLLI